MIGTVGMSDRRTEREKSVMSERLHADGEYTGVTTSIIRTENWGGGLVFII